MFVGDSVATSVPVRRRSALERGPSRLIAVATLLSLAAGVRLVHLSASGYSEDEINKLRAVRAYDRLAFTANAEHPMLMKFADWASTSAVRAWNSQPLATPRLQIAPESAIRLPNALVGAATTGVVFLLAEALFDSTVGGWAALFWAIDVNAVGINRVGKEDTFLVFFLLLASYLYERGKTAPDLIGRDRWYLWSGASFGLMLASKYMPHYLGVHALYNFVATGKRGRTLPRTRPSFYAAIAASLLVGNFALLLPDTWYYLAAYLRGDTLRHSGYDYAHRIFVNTLDATPWGLPPTFYLTFFATKISLVVLVAAVIGLAWTIHHRVERGATFVRVFLLFTLLPYSFVASKFLRYMLPVLAVIDIVAAIGVVVVLRRINAMGTSSAHRLAGAAIVACAIGAPLTLTLTALPYPALAQNAAAAWLVPRGSLFPDDELYDARVPEAVAAIAREAASGAVICSDAVSVVEEYLERLARPDVRSCSTSHDGLPMGAEDTWVIVQDGHIYFENVPVIELLRRAPPWLEIEAGGVRAVQIFHITRAAADGGAQ
jgi:hypothetical protein